MKFYADVHLHSYYSRATSKNLNLEHLYKWAQLKGIQVVGTGDCVHPGWLDELQEKLEPAEEGLYRLKAEYARDVQKEVPSACEGEVRFMLTVEISNIYKRLGRVRKVHNVVFMPHFEAALNFQARMESIGNIRSDGRPILGLDSRDLLEIVLETDPLAYLIPAHIWTPWFSALGSRSGFDRMEDCFGDLSSHIFAVETGLSSDPPMNWRLSQLDPYILVSNSDAHSPQKLAREATVYDTELSYPSIYRALSDPDDPGLIATVEFFPEEGKYHLDGHRKCQTRMQPRETIAAGGLCPECGQPVTVGVLARVEELADREEGEKSARWRPYFSLIPLPEIISDAIGVGVNSKKVQSLFQHLLAKTGNELYVLQDAPLEDISRLAGPVVAEGIRRMRTGDVHIAAGYDGAFGEIRLFTPEERKEISQQKTFFPDSLNKHIGKNEPTGAKRATASQEATSAVAEKSTPAAGRAGEHGNRSEKESTVRDYLLPYQQYHADKMLRSVTAEEDQPFHVESSPDFPDIRFGNQLPEDVNTSQWKAVTHFGDHLLIVAGPGTGKTHTLTYRIAHFAQCFSATEDMLAITFTNRAAEELHERLRQRLQPHEADAVTVGTFHSFCLHLLRQYATATELPDQFELATEEHIETILSDLWPELSAAERKKRRQTISLWKARGVTEFVPDDVQAYNRALRRHNLLDFDDLLLETLKVLREKPAIADSVRSSYRYIFVDEYQDINAVQHQLLTELVRDGVHITAIGDPNQAIYGFRGSDPRFFDSFSKDFGAARTIYLSENYRSAVNLLTASGQVIQSGRSDGVPSLTAKIISEGRLTIHEAGTEKAEAEYVVHQIERSVGGTSMFSQDSGRVAAPQNAERSFADFAVLYRLNTQAQALREAFARSGIPFRIVGDKPLLSRKGIREMIDFLRFANGAELPAHALAELLVFLVDGLGPRTAEKLTAGWPQRDGKLSFQAVRDAGEAAAGKAAPVLHDCAEIADKLHDQGVIAAMHHLVVLPVWREKFTSDSELNDNWQQLVRVSRLRKNFGDFLDYLMLQRAEDEYEARSEHVTLMTLHASKGLEFPVVFIVGCEQELLPLELEGYDTDMAEERRLFYVGMTRARENLYLVRAKKRTLFGKSRATKPSPFLKDIEEQLKAYEQTTPRRRNKTSRQNPDQLSLF